MNPTLHEAEPAMLVLVPRRADRASILSLVVIHVAATMLTAASQQVCQHVPEAGGLKFTDEYPTKTVVETATTYSYLSCCTGRQSNVNHTWYKCINNRWCLQTAQSECDKSMDWNYRHTGEDGQTLKFEDSDAIADSGIYLCSATDGKSTINRTFTLLVVDCETNPKKIRFSAPSDAQTSVNKVFSQVCQGDFGCYGAVDSSTEAWWSYLDEHGNLHNLSQETQGHYRIQETISQDETKKTASLIIRPVTEEDFHRVFICSLHKKGLPPAGFNLTLSKIEIDEPWQRYIPYIVVSALVVVMILVTWLLTYLMCGSLVAFKWRSARDTLPRRGPGHVYDAMLLAGDDDEEGEGGRVMRMLSSTLHQKGYKIYTSQLGRSRVKQIDHIEECVTVIFIISSCKTSSEDDTSYEDDRFSGFSRFIGVCADNNANIVLIPTQNLPDVEWHNMSKDYKKVYKNIPKLFNIVKWPQNGFMKWKNFLSKVQSQLPKIKDAAIERETKISHPLLTEQRSPGCENVNRC